MVACIVTAHGLSVFSILVKLKLIVEEETDDDRTESEGLN